MRSLRSPRSAVLRRTGTALLTLAALALAPGTVPRAMAFNPDCPVTRIGRDIIINPDGSIIPWDRPSQLDTPPSETSDDDFPRCMHAWVANALYRIGGRGFLGREWIGSGVPEVGVVRPGTTLTGYGGGVSLGWALPGGDSFGINPFGGDSGPFDQAAVLFSLQHAHVNGQTYWPMFSPGEGHALLFPGPLGGPTGVALPGFPANTVYDLTYDTRLEWSAGELNYDLYRQRQTESFGLRFGLMYSLLNQHETLAGRIPGYQSDFLIRNDFRTQATGVHLGLHWATRLNGASSVGWTWTAHALAQVGVAQVRVRGTMAQEFDGFIGGIVPPYAATDRISGTAAYGSFGFGLSATSPDGRRAVFGGVNLDHRPWGAAMVADGEGPARVVRQSMRTATLRLGAVFRF